MGTTTTASIEITGARDAVTLDYRIRSDGEDWQSVHQRVPIRWTPCRFGGERPWFVCDVTPMGCIAADGLPRSMVPAGYLPAGIATASDMRCNATGRWTELIITCDGCIAS